MIKIQLQEFQNIIMIYLKRKKLQVKLHVIDGGHGLGSMPTIGSIIKEYIN